MAGSSIERRGEAELMRASSGPSAGRLMGIEIHLDWSLLVVFLLVSVDLGLGIFPAWHPRWSPVLIWSVAVGAAVLFVVSVLLHELSHALVARAQGIRVRRVTLFLFGGLTEMEGDAATPRGEFLLAIVGPVTSAVIGLIASSVGWSLAGGEFQALDPTTADAATVRHAISGLGPGATLLLWLGPINLMLAAFNVLPGFPLDGGRVLRSILWWMTGDLLRATRWAAFVGRAFAWLLMALGVVSLFAGGVGQGIWLLLIGWFLNNAARMSYANVRAKQALQNIPVTRLMWTQPERVSPDLMLDRFVNEHVVATDASVFAVERDDGELVGLVTFDDVRRVPQSAWPTVRVADIMAPLRDLPTLPPNAPAEQALAELGRRDVEQIPVLEGSHLRGIVRRRDLLRWLALHGQPAEV